MEAFYLAVLWTLSSGSDASVKGQTERGVIGEANAHLP